MSYTTNLKKIHDTPFWFPANQFRSTTSALCSMAATNGAVHRYIYYMLAGFFYRYDTQQDSHNRLQTPPVAPITKAALHYNANWGTYGNCLGATSTTITVPPLGGTNLVGKEIEIIGGTGAGQVRNITASAAVEIYDSGTVSSASTTSITDSTKKWKINELVGMQIRFISGTGVMQHKKILFNSEVQIFVQDVTLNKLEVWNNSAFSASVPYALPASTAGSATQYFIERVALTVSSAWTVTPDYSSSYVIKGGGVLMLSALAGAPFSSLQYYDCLADVWTTKNNLSGFILAALSTDFDITTGNEKVYVSGTASSGGARTITDSLKTLLVDRFTNFEVRITGGTGMGQNRLISSNTETSFEVIKPWDIAPDATSTYEIRSNSNAVWMTGHAASSLYKYCLNEDQWYSGTEIDFGVARVISCQFNGQEAFSVTTGIITNSAITSLSATPTAGGTGYVVGDTFTITTGGSLGKGKVTAVTAGVVTAVELYSAGSTYTTGAGKATTALLGAGTGLTVNILTIGTVCRITTGTVHNLVVGDSVTFAGCTEAAYNTAYSVVATDTTTTFEISTSATASMVATLAQSTTLLVDVTKNWVVNEHVGKLVKMETIAATPTVQFRRISANTANTISFVTATAPVSGTGAYSICQPEAFGREKIENAQNQFGAGRATNGSTSTIEDTTKSWTAGQWVGYRVRIMAGTGVGNEFAITGNTNNTLVFGAQSFTVDTSTVYQIMVTYGTATAGTTTTLTDSTKNWPVNYFSGKRLIITSGTGARQEILITSNTATALTFGVSTAPDTTSTYTILGINVRAANTSLIQLHTYGDSNKDGTYLVSSRGSTFSVFDLYDITKNTWGLTMFNIPQSDVLTTYSSLEYDGIDSVYFTTTAISDFTQVHKINLVNRMTEPVSQSPFLETATAHVGQLISLVTGSDGGLFMFLGLHTSRLMYKCLLK